MKDFVETDDGADDVDDGNSVAAADDGEYAAKVAVVDVLVAVVCDVDAAADDDGDHDDEEN